MTWKLLIIFHKNPDNDSDVLKKKTNLSSKKTKKTDILSIHINYDPVFELQDLVCCKNN